MSHDIEASYAATEVVAELLATPGTCFSVPPAAGTLSGYAAREGRYEWPHADGVVELAVAAAPGVKNYSIALEFKRKNEGLHGVLTAIGQAHAYIRKGYSGAAIVIPEDYPGFGNPGPYVRDVLDMTSAAEAIGVFTYGKPTLSAISPFAGKLQLHRSMKIDVVAPIVAPRPLSRTETQWAHVREGSTDPDAFFKYLQSVKLLGGGGAALPTPLVPPSLVAAANRLRPGVPPERYLSNCLNDDISDRAWRHFWFKYVLHPQAIDGWSQNANGDYLVNHQHSLILRSDNAGPKLFFAGRADSIKNKLVRQLNARAIGVRAAYDQLASNYFKRAHSYREDIDSGCEHLGFVNSDGRLSESGYNFVDACERYGNPNDGIPRAIFLKALLGEGALGAFIHYIHRLSEERFAANPLDFTTPNRRPGAVPVFDQTAYLDWIEGEMANRLHVIRKVAARGGAARRPFQAELAVLRSVDVIGEFRLGVGLIVNWPELQEAMTFSGFAH